MMLSKTPDWTRVKNTSTRMKSVELGMGYTSFFFRYDIYSIFCLFFRYRYRYFHRYINIKYSVKFNIPYEV